MFPESGDPALVEERRFNGCRTPLEALREDVGSEHRIKRFRTQETVVIVVTGRFNMQNPPKLTLVREAQVVVIVEELEGEMLEAEWSGGAGNNLQHAGHPQVHRYERFVVQHQEQVLGAARLGSTIVRPTMRAWVDSNPRSPRTPSNAPILSPVIRRFMTMALRPIRTVSTSGSSGILALWWGPGAFEHRVRV